MTELSRWSMLSLCQLPGFVKDILRNTFELTEIQARPTPETLAECAPGHDVLLTSLTAPHIGSSTVEARQPMAEILFSGIVQWRCGQKARNRVAWASFCLPATFHGR
jgi:lactate dehydrogenase-like 2-hydroxyacid dehydrogenase